jgi:hypothetical protein
MRPFKATLSPQIVNLEMYYKTNKAFSSDQLPMLTKH